MRSAFQVCLAHGFLVTAVGRAAAVSNRVFDVSTNKAAVVQDLLRDITGPVDIATRWTWLGRVLFAVGLVLLGWWLWHLWQKNRAKNRADGGISPEALARERLRSAWAYIDNPPHFCSLVSVIVRDFLGGKFGWLAPKQTTEEFLAEYASGDSLAPHHRDLLEDFLSRCDLVKFGRYEAARSKLEDLHQAALRAVEETTAPPPPTLPVIAPGSVLRLEPLDSVHADSDAQPALVGDERYMPRERSTLKP